MPRREYRASDGDSVLGVEWSGKWEDVRVTLDGAEIGQISTERELDRGKSFETPSGGSVRVKLLRGIAARDFEVRLDGRLAEGSPSDAGSLVKLCGVDTAASASRRSWFMSR